MFQWIHNFLIGSSVDLHVHVHFDHIFFKKKKYTLLWVSLEVINETCPKISWKMFCSSCSLALYVYMYSVPATLTKVHGYKINIWSCIWMWKQLSLQSKQNNLQYTECTCTVDPQSGEDVSIVAKFFFLHAPFLWQALLGDSLSSLPLYTRCSHSNQLVQTLCLCTSKSRGPQSHQPGRHLGFDMDLEI